MSCARTSHQTKRIIIREILPPVAMLCAWIPTRQIGLHPLAFGWSLGLLESLFLIYSLIAGGYLRQKDRRRGLDERPCSARVGWRATPNLARSLRLTQVPKTMFPLHCRRVGSLTCWEPAAGVRLPKYWFIFSAASGKACSQKGLIEEKGGTLKNNINNIILFGVWK